jgi:hypothetical protein
MPGQSPLYFKGMHGDYLTPLHALAYSLAFLREAGFSVRPIYLGFIRHKVTVGQFFLRLLRCCLVSIMPLILCDLFVIVCV